MLCSFLSDNALDANANVGRSCDLDFQELSPDFGQGTGACRGAALLRGFSKAVILLRSEPGLSLDSGYWSDMRCRSEMIVVQDSNVSLLLSTQQQLVSTNTLTHIINSQI